MNKRLTLKLAKAVAMKVLGTAKGLEKDPYFDDAPYSVFQMHMGDFKFVIRYDIYGSDRIEVAAHGPMNVAFALYDPVTLNEDFEEEERRRKQARREDFEEWVNGCGPEICKEQVDKCWNKER